MTATTTPSPIALSVSYAFNQREIIPGHPQAAHAQNWPGVTWTLQEIANHVHSGKAICVALLKDNYWDEAHFVSSQLIFIDLDEGPSVQRLQSYPLVANHAFLLYATARSTPTAPRSRIGFVLDQPIYEMATYKRLVTRLIDYMKPMELKPDKCKSAAQMFFGSLNPDISVFPENILPLTFLESLPPTQIELLEQRRAELPMSVRSNTSPVQEFSPLSHNTQDFLAQGAPEGERNNRLYAAACDLAGNEYSERDAYSALFPAAAHSGLTESEIETTIRSAFSQPRSPSRPPLTRHRKNRTGAGTTAAQDNFADGGELDDLTQQQPDKLKIRPNDADLGDSLIARWQGKYAYFYERWNEYTNGVWQPVENLWLQGQIWDVMKAEAERKVTPSKARAASILEYLTTQLFILNTAVDQGAAYINLANGLFNLDTGELEPHQRDFYLTTQLEFDYNPEADCPTWKQFLAQALITAPDQPDVQLIDLLQEAFGYSLTADTHLETAFWLYGEGAGGKSTTLKILEALLGSAYTTLDLNLLDTNHYQLANVPGKRVVACAEAKANSKLADSILKPLISGEELLVRQIYQTPFTFKPQAKVWWAMNERPQNSDRSNAIYRRLKIIPFNNPVPDERQDRHLSTKLRAELPGIFNWAIAGLQRLRGNDRFTYAEQVSQALEAYRSENDTEAAFVNDIDWCVLQPEASVQASDLYIAYKAWCQRYGHPFKSSTKIAYEWERLGFPKEKHGRMFYQAIGLTDTAVSAIIAVKREEMQPPRR